MQKSRWPFNYCELGPKAQCGSLVLAVIPRNCHPLNRSHYFEDQPRRILAVEDLQTMLMSKQLPPELSSWIVFDQISYTSLSPELLYLFHQNVITAMGNLEPRPLPNLQALAVEHAIRFLRENLDKVFVKPVDACFYVYHGQKYLFADDSAANWIVDEMSGDIQVIGALLDTFTHASADKSQILNGGMAGPYGVHQLMPSFHIPFGGMLVHLYVSGLPTGISSRSAEFGRLCQLLVDSIYAKLAEIINLDGDENEEDLNDIITGMLNKDRVNLFFDDFVANFNLHSNSSLQEAANSCVETLLLKPHVSIAATYSHSDNVVLPPVCSKQLVAMSSMASHRVCVDDTQNLILGTTPNIRNGSLLPFIMYNT